ncbi:MAG: hypothetical protein AAGJ69_02095 [Cyanobacteria bacterium J06559_1]
MVTLPEEMHQQLKALAEQEGVSVGQYIFYAIARQVEAVENDARLNAPTEDVVSQSSDRVGMPLPDTKQAQNSKIGANQATTLGTNSVDVDHL